MMLKPSHFSRYGAIGRLVWRHGRSPAFRQLLEDPELTEGTANGDVSKANPEELVRDLEKMGPTFVKLGQVLSSRSDLLPEPYLKALARLQDKVEPFPFAQVEKMVQDELGVRLSKAFLEFEPTPLAAASLGQVHRAVLREGHEVAVKVQRPAIRQRISQDLQVLEELANFADEHTQFGRRHHLSEVVEQFRRALIHELDYQREASNLSTVGENLREFSRIVVVSPVPDYTSRAVLTMSYLRGQKLTELSPVVRLDANGPLLADELFRAYLKQVLVDGLFHADPHPGNVFLTEDGRVGLLDLGMVGRVAPQMQQSLIKLLLAISEGRAEEAAAVAIQVSKTDDGFDETAFKRQVSDVVLEMRERTLTKIDPGRALLEVSRAAGKTGLFVPSELTLLGKTLLQLHEIGRCLEPSFNPNQAIGQHVSAILERRFRKDLTPGNLFASLVEAKEFVGQLPGRVSKLMDTFGNGQLELKLRVDDTLRVLDGFQKVANRIAAGLILAALVIGAALLMQVRTQFELFGYPGMAILCFIAAALGSVWLLFDIFFRDSKGPPKAPR
jgi:predicted unusual protein kinase regulating ubiquinone biosynthesis (AarF/ABC1/UbiB family)